MSEPAARPESSSQPGMSDGLAFLVMLLTPLAFSSNAVFGRAAVQSVEPFTLGFLRWSAVALILLPFCWRQLRDHWPSLKANWRLVLLMGFLGQWICGAIFYLALTFTTAANGILIYSSVPAIIIVIERLFLGRALIPRQVTGIFIAMFGIGYIMVRGSLEELLAFRFNPGDAIVLITSLSWALYSIFLRKPVFQNMGNAAVLNIVSCAGALLLAPVAVFEMVWLGSFPTSGEAWSSIAGIVFVASMLPLYREGDVLVVSATAQVHRGDRVVVKTLDGEVMAKVLSKRTEKSVELESINPDFPNRQLKPHEIDWIHRILWARQ